MENWLGGNKRENIVSICAGLISLVLLFESWLITPAFAGWDQVLLAVVLTGFIILADRFPIHIRYAVKVSMTSVPLFLVALLLQLPLALLAAGIALLATDYLARHERGLLPIYFIMDSARWIIIVFLGSISTGITIHSGTLQHLNLFIVALVMYAADVLTFSIFTSLNIEEPFLGLVHENFRQTYAIEGIQYLTGILGVLAYYQVFWAPLLLVIPTVSAYIAFKSVKEMRRSTSEILIHMADAVDLRDPITGGHSRRVAELAGKIVRHMQVLGAEAELVEAAARLHDIGKIGIPDLILNKPGAFTSEDWAIMEQHSAKGAYLLSGHQDFARGADIVLCHHERWDGHGYPAQKKGYEIPFGARVIAVADAFDAITTDRPYRFARSVSQALQILNEGSGTQWDPEVVKALEEVLVENKPLEFIPPPLEPSKRGVSM
jgi:putative nucleotidyltransferase with HDIG domain